MENFHQNMTVETVEVLKSKGFLSVQFIPQKFENNNRAVVEVIPAKEPDFQMDSIALDSQELQDYFGKPSYMVRYVIDEKYLKS